MDTRRQKHKLNNAIILLLWILTSCTLTQPTTLPKQTPALPTISFKSAPTLLCRSATQIRLTPQIVGGWSPNTVGEWTLTAADNQTALTQGKFSPEENQLFAAFPGGKTMSPGLYRLTLRVNNTVLAQHTFSITAHAPTVTNLTVAMLPTGPDITRLEAGSHHFYVRYAYHGMCPGAPYWITVTHDDETVCAINATLDTDTGVETMPCYREDGQTLDAGTYKVELSLMGEIHQNITFEVGDAPIPPTPTPRATATPSPTPSPPPILCEPLFTAAALTTDGKPFLALDYFDWYSQAIFAGSQCENLTQATSWETAWFHNGELIRKFSGAWYGKTSGVIWDSITGIPEAPFLLPGTYTVTMTVGDTPPLTAAFRILYYPTPTP